MSEEYDAEGKRIGLIRKILASIIGDSILGYERLRVGKESFTKPKDGLTSTDASEEMASYKPTSDLDEALDTPTKAVTSETNLHAQDVLRRREEAKESGVTRHR